jgi:hypothetical protein
LIDSEHVKFEEHEEGQDETDDYGRHVLSEKHGELQVFGFRPQVLAVLAQIAGSVGELRQIAISVEQHLEGLTHYLAHVHQFAIQLFNILLRICVAEILALPVDLFFYHESEYHLTGWLHSRCIASIAGFGMG